MGSDPMTMNQPILASSCPRSSGRYSDWTQVDPIRQMSLRK